MRLTCPECEARYDVDDALIPAQGRVVECARCAHRWHQPGVAPVPILLGDPEVSPEIAVVPPPDAAPLPRPSAAVLEILREEAERELSQRAAARARAADRARVGSGGGPVSAAPEPAETDRTNAALGEIEPDLGREAARRDKPRGRSDPRPDPAPGPAQGPSAPQPEFVVAELVADDELPGWTVAEPPHWTKADEPKAPTAGQPPRAMAGKAAAARRGGGYDAGFALALALALLAGGAYVAAPHLAGAGGVGAALQDYRAGADRARLWLFDRAAPLTDNAIGALDG